MSRLLMGLTVGLGLALAGTAFADGRGHGPSGPGDHGMPGPGTHATPGPVKDRLCLHFCKDDARACTATAQAAMRQCRTTKCAAAIKAARTACAGNETSKACTEARAAVQPCLSACRESFRTALEPCGTHARDCVAICPDRGSTPQKDPTCVAACKETLSGCLTTVRTNAQECRDDCSDLVDAARMACEADHHSTECKEARTAASACVQPCLETQRTEHAACDQAAGTCVQACPTVATPTPTPSASASGR